MRFPSAEWALAFQHALNENSAYAEAARSWVGDILLRVVPEAPTAASPGIHLDLAHGECRSATYYADAREVAAEFKYEGAIGAWKKLTQHEVDPVKALLAGTFQIKGNLAKAARFTRAAKELVETAAAIPTEW